MRMLRCILYLSLVASVLPQRIAGGVELHDPTKFPFFAILKIFKPFNSTHDMFSMCGGSLIHPQWILTAGHCLPNDTSLFDWIANYDRDMVFMGNVHVPPSQLGQARKIKRIHRHPEYMANTNPDGTLKDLRNDVAILKVRRPFKLSDTVQPIPLFFQKCLPYIIGIGIGLIGVSNDSPMSDTVKYAKFIPDFRPLAYPSHHLFIGKFEEGAIDDPAAGFTLRGDSGGPIICDTVHPPSQIGIISMGNAEIVNGKFRVTTYLERVDFYTHSFIYRYVPVEKKSVTSAPVASAKSHTLHLFSIVFISILYMFIIY